MKISKPMESHFKPGINESNSMASSSRYSLFLEQSVILGADKQRIA